MYKKVNKDIYNSKNKEWKTIRNLLLIIFGPLIIMLLVAIIMEPGVSKKENERLENIVSDIEIAIENSFTMEEVAKAFTFCKTSGFFSKEVPNLVSAIAGFIAGKYITGEYFIRARKMTIEQLDEVLNKQQEINASGKHVFIAELMVQLGFVRELDVKSIIFMKEEEGKRFSLSTKDIPTIALEKESFDIRVENTKLKEENEILKEKINAILTYIKEHKET